MKVQKSSGVTNNTSTQRSRSAPTISGIRSGVEKYMVMGPENNYIVDLLLAVALSKETDRPLWLMIVAPPSSGKTEMLRLISTNPEYHQIPSLTPRFLFSGHPTTQGGYMLREVGKKGILAFPDFTTVLSMSSANRREIFNQLRVIHDGEAGRGTGIDIGEAKIWKAKVAVVACVTDTIERIREQSNDLGERFLYYRYNPKDPEYAEISSRISPDRARLTVQRNVKRFVRIRKAALRDQVIDRKEDQILLLMAQFVGRARAPVVREGGTHEIQYVHPHEQPFRVLGGFQTLYRCLLVVNDGDAVRSMKIVQSVTVSSVPASRIEVLQAVAGGEMAVNEVAAKVGLPDTTVRRTIEEMEAQTLLQPCSVNGTKQKDYRIHPDFHGLCVTAGLISGIEAKGW